MVDREGGGEGGKEGGKEGTGQGAAQEERLENLFGLIEDGLKALQAENRDRERTAAVLGAAAEKASQMVPSIQDAVEQAVGRAIEDRIEEITSRAAQKIDAASEKSAQSFDQAGLRAQGAAGSLEAVAAKLRKKWWHSSLLASGALLGSVLLTAGITAWLINPALGQLRAEDRSLRADVGDFEKLYSEWVERFKKEQLIPCWPSGKGKEKRLCYTVDTRFKPIKEGEKTYMVVAKE